MRVSIITATFNSEKFLEGCMNSVLNQDYGDIEYIVVDGGSTDSTIGLIRSQENKIRWISESDNGIYDAINKGIRMATGEIIGILNSDDLFSDSQVVSRVVESFQKRPVEILFSDVDFFEAGNSNKKIRHYSSKNFRPWMFRFGFQPAHPTFYTYKRNFDKFGYYNPKYRIAGDFELLLRFLLKEKLSYRYVNDTWVNMRTGGASTKNLRSKVRLNREIMDACKANGLYSSYLLVYSKYFFKWWGFIFTSKK